MKFLNTTHPMKQTTLKSIFTLIGGLVLFTILFTQCRKDKSIPFCEQYPDQCVSMHRIKDHYYFKKGSWWVYQEQNTGAIDSQWVSKSWSDGCKFDLVINTTLDDYDYHRWTHLLTLSEDCGIVEKRKLAYIERSKTKAGDYVGGSFIGMFYPIVGDSLNNFLGGGYGSSTYYSQLRIRKISIIYKQLNVNYINVIEISDDFNIVENSQPTTHWYAEGVGLIKKELIDSNQVWLLTKYNVEQ